MFKVHSLVQWFSARRFCPFRAIDNVGRHFCLSQWGMGRACAADTWCVKARDAVKHRVTLRTATVTQIILLSVSAVPRLETWVQPMGSPWQASPHIRVQLHCCPHILASSQGEFLSDLLVIQQFPNCVASLGFCPGWPSCFEHASLGFFSYELAFSFSCVSPWVLHPLGGLSLPLGPFSACPQPSAFFSHLTYHTVMRWIFVYHDIFLDLTLPPFKWVQKSLGPFLLCLCIPRCLELSGYVILVIMCWLTKRTNPDQ